MQFDLSIIIPSLNEIYFGKTIEDILKHSEGNTEIIAVLDGWKPNYELPKNERLRIIYFEKSQGQRRAMNLGVKESNAKYIIKCDSHIALSQGFDVAMLKDIELDSVIIPSLGTLNVKNWTIPPTPLNSNFVLNTNLEFHYAPNIPELVHETMTIQGSGFMVSRENYWKWNLCDEVFGSWGMGGAEVALKTWLLGGRVLSTKNAFMGHWFRMPEDGGDGFPYERDMQQVNHAFAYAKELFLGNKLKGQKRSMQWLVEKFNFPLDWTPEKAKELCALFNDVVE